MMKVLIVESEFLHQDTWVGSAVERLADALSRQNVTVIKSTSFDDGYAILAANEAIDCLMFSYQMEQQDEHLNVRQLIGKLHERQQNVPVFLLGDREKATASLDRDLLELVDEFAWIMEDTADFIAGRAVAAMTRYRQQLLPRTPAYVVKRCARFQWFPARQHCKCSLMCQTKSRRKSFLKEKLCGGVKIKLSFYSVLSSKESFFSSATGSVTSSLRLAARPARL